MEASSETLSLPMQNYFLVFLLRHASVHGQSLFAALICQTLILTLEILPVIPAKCVVTKISVLVFSLFTSLLASFCSTKTDKSFNNISILYKHYPALLSDVIFKLIHFNTEYCGMASPTKQA